MYKEFNKEYILDHEDKAQQPSENVRELGKSNNSTTKLDEDTILMMSAINGDRCAYNCLYKKYFLVITCFIAKLNGDFELSEDIAQKVFLRIWNSEIEFKCNSSVRTFLLSVAKYVLSEHKRKEGKEFLARQLLIIKYDTSYSTKRIQDEAIYSESAKNLKKALVLLNEKQRQAIELYYNKRLTSREAAKVANCTEKAFECRLARARRKLQKILRI